MAEDTQALWREYRRNRDQHLRDRLILSYAPLVKYVAGRLGSGLPAHVDEGDLVSYGLLGLIGAIERYDPERDVKFETYAISRIKGSIIDERTGAIRTVPTGRVGGGGFQHDIASDGRRLWALRYERRSRSALVRFDSRTGRRTGRATLPGIADAVVVRPHAVWVATVASHWETVIRFDPRTLRRTLLVHIL